MKIVSFNTERNVANRLIKWLGIGCLAAVGLAATVFATSNAFFSTQAESGAITTNASVIVDASASGGQAVAFGNVNSPVIPPSTPGWQLTAANVGLAPFGLDCNSLPVYTGSLKPAAGARISNVRITGNLNLSNGDIEIDRSCIKPSSGDNRALVSNDICGQVDCLVESTIGVTIRDSEFDASALPASSIATSCAFRGVGTLIRNYIHGMGSGICFFGTGPRLNGLAQQNYVTDLRSYGDSHNEAGTVRDFIKNAGNTRTVKWIGNRLFCDGNVTASLFIQPTWEDIYNLWVTDNYLEGGGFNLYSAGGQTGAHIGNAHATNNRFRATGWGPVWVNNVEPWDEWSENYHYDAASPGGKGTIIPNP